MIIPATRYRDPEAALLFLVGVLGLEEQAVYRDDEGNLIHAELRLGDGLMMFGPAGRGGLDPHLADPGEIGGRETTTIYAVVPDATDLHGRAVEAGARIVMPLAEQSHGGTSFSVADPEGHIWTFGTYNPLARR
ncbi:glyoxalase [Rhodovulum sp. BSW8]|uniref:Extradiol dioxygenase n=1 Tax=Rhodovulum visakhapatnamense TaxID=364297 RepID=A0ABS1REU4_9RHOB|nr:MULTISPECIES: VOC family protein [Rhodovulum]MBL3568836.1 extradiol dioxygenase [Rhodovulum visakhapatnamense]MBL3578163.1 extradiol dioxygenase [Rhodovulum visakhapatnamense]OLS44454.1 hypothetical protein BV509_08945 [Rhodovulum sulfidophilum]RBO53532.1 glyoxalase [Rhodovulum sp. BSW8]